MLHQLPSDDILHGYQTCPLVESFFCIFSARKFRSDHEIFITKIYFNANLERFTKFVSYRPHFCYELP